MLTGLRVSEVTAGVASVVAAVTAELRSRGVDVFATIDHAANAHAVGMELADEVLLVFGSPAVGTALMQADPTVGYDLPLRMLIWSDAGSTHVAFEDPGDLTARYALDSQQPTLTRLRELSRQLVEVARAAR